MNTDWNWLQAPHPHTPPPDPAPTMGVFAGQKLVVVGGSSGIGRQTATDVVAAGGSAVIVGHDPTKVDDTVTALATHGKAWGVTADLADRAQTERVCRQLADQHTDASLLVNAAGLFVPTPFLAYDGAAYDAYLELDRAIFFLPRRWRAAWSPVARAGRSSTSAACGPTRPSPPPPRRGTRWPRAACTP